MKTARKVIVTLVLLLFPVAVLAQGTGAWNYSWWQGFSGGSMMTGGFSGMYGSYGSMGAGAGSGIWYVAGIILQIINGVLVPILFAISFIVFLYGVAKSYIFSNGSDKAVEEGHKIILWGIIGFAVMISVWGLVNVAVETLGLSGGRPFVPSVSPYVGPFR